MSKNESVTDKVSKSAVALILRQIFAFIINVGGGVLLARLLTIEEFGIYAIVIFAMNFLKVFGDVGLAASLIRKKEDPTGKEYAAIFTIQQVLVITAVVIFWLFAPWLTQQYELSESYVWLFRLVALSLIPTSFMVIPQVQLERELSFDKIAIIEVSQALTFNIVAVLLAWYGYGAYALGWALMARSTIGGILANIVQPWAMQLKWRWGIVKKHLWFGIPFQATNLISTLNSAVNPILIGLFFSVAGAGYVEWAILLTGYLQRPLLLLNRLLYPAFSRVKDKISKLSRALNYSYVAGSFVFFALLGMLFGLAPEITRIIYTDKWVAAIPLVYLLILSKISISMSITNGAAGYALGWANTILYLNIAGSLLLWIAVGLFIAITDSILAYGYAVIIQQCINLPLYFMLKKELPELSVVKTQMPFLLAAVATALILMQVSNIWVVQSWVSLSLALIAGAFLYLIFVVFSYFIYRRFSGDDTIIKAMKFLYKNFSKTLKKS